jgi:hypothetical protein
MRCPRLLMYRSTSKTHLELDDVPGEPLGRRMKKAMDQALEQLGEGWEVIDWTWTKRKLKRATCEP